MKNLKVIVIGLLVVFGFSGCMSEKVYNTGKVVYKGAKTVYIELPVKDAKLEMMDNVVVTYDKVRTVVKEEIAIQKDKKKLNVFSSTVQQN